MQTNTKQSRRLGRGLSGLLEAPVPVEAPGRSAAAQPEAPPVLPTPPVPPALDAPVGRAADARGAEAGGRGLIEIDVTRISPNPWQPRRAADETGLKALAASIAASGVMQPIAVRRRTGADTFEIVAGERRWRAAQMAGLARVPALVVDLDDRQSAEWALVENVQREDLNPIDCALALCGLHEKFGLTQAQIAERTGMQRSSVANLMRLMELEPEARALIERGELTAGHGKALLGARPGAERVMLASICAEEGWTVRDLEDVIRGHPSEAEAKALIERSREARDAQKTGPNERTRAAAKDLAKRLSDHLGTRVRVRTDATGKRGRITIEFYDLDQLDGVLKRMRVGGE